MRFIRQKGKGFQGPDCGAKIKNRNEQRFLSRDSRSL